MRKNFKNIYAMHGSVSMCNTRMLNICNWEMCTVCLSDGFLYESMRFEMVFLLFTISPLDI